MAEWLFVSRRGIVHTSVSLSDNAATLCGKGTRDLVLIGAVGIGERPCLSCAAACVRCHGGTHDEATR